MKLPGSAKAAVPARTPQPRKRSQMLARQGTSTPIPSQLGQTETHPLILNSVNSVHSV